MSLSFDSKINWGTIINLVAMACVVIGVFIYMQSDVAMVKQQQEVQERFRQDVRSNYINREQLDYMVIQRIDRMERNINAKLDRIEKALDD